jgi:hypothetical protein
VPGGRPAQPPRDGDDVARPGPVPGDGLAAAQVAQGGDRDRDRLAARHVPAGHPGAGGAALVADAVHELHGPGDGEFGGDDEGEQQGGGDGAHGGDVGEVLGGGLAADVVGGGPVAAEVAALDEDVRAGDGPPVRGRDQRRVVARAKEHGGSGGDPGGQLPDQPELPEFAHAALHVAQFSSCLKPHAGCRCRP